MAMKFELTVDSEELKDCSDACNELFNFIEDKFRNYDKTIKLNLKTETVCENSSKKIEILHVETYKSTSG
jgi:hypothetical protein